MTKIITIHGTNAGDESDSGEQWWQLGSAFQTRLQALIKQKLEFIPFHWSGANSENERRKASRALLKMTRKLEKADETYGIIGHSHGGSVAVEMLRLATLLQTAKSRVGQFLTTTGYFFALDEETFAAKRNALRFWATVGAPLINYPHLGAIRLMTVAINRFIIPTFIFLFWAIFLTVLAPFLFILSLTWITAGDLPASAIDQGITEMLVRAMRWAMTGAITALGIVVVIFFGAAISLQGWLFRLSTTSLSGKRRALFPRYFEENWVSLTDSADEAVNALRMSEGATVKITPPGLGARPLATSIALVITTILYVCVHYYLRVHPANYTPMQDGDMMIFRFILDVFQSVLGLVYGAEPSTESVVIGVLNYVGTTFTLAALLTPFTKIVSRWIANTSDNIISSFARKSAFGIDLPLLEKPSVSLAPAEFSTEWRTLPHAPSAAVHEFANRHAADLVAKGRQLLGFAQLGLTNDELLRQITETVTWNELIHTAYFEVDEFIKLLAYAIIQKCELEPSREFLTDPDYDRIKEWHDEIAPRFSGHPA